MNSRNRVPADLPGLKLTNGLRILLSVIGGVLVIGIIESTTTLYTLLRFGLQGTQAASAVYAASAIAGGMLLAASLAASAVLGSSFGQRAWSMQRGLFRPLISLAVAIYVGLLLYSLCTDPATLRGELLIDKRLSICIYGVLSGVATVIEKAIKSGSSRSGQGLE